MDLSFKDFFIIEEEHDKVSVSGSLKCSCGMDRFLIYHTGKQTKGILSPHIKKMEKQILIEAKCSKCGRTIQIYDNTIDGEKPAMASVLERKQFLHKGMSEFKTKIVLNYYEESYMTNRFVTIYVYLFGDNGKQIVLYEE